MSQERGLGRIGVGGRLAGLVVAVALIGACGGETPMPTPAGAPLFFPQHGSPLGAGDAALLEGEAVFEDGCLWIESPAGARFLALWPADVEAGVINGLPAVLSSEQELLVETGSPTSLGGSQTDAATAERLVGPIPDACTQHAFWVVSMVGQRP